MSTDRDPDVDIGDDDQYLTIGDREIDMDGVVGTTAPEEHPYEVGKCGELVVMGHEGTRPHLEYMGVEAAWELISDLTQAADRAGQFKKQKQRERETEQPFDDDEEVPF